MGRWRVFEAQKQGLRLVRTIVSQSCTSIRNAVRFHEIYLVSVSGCSVSRNLHGYTVHQRYQTFSSPTNAHVEFIKTN